MLKKKLKKYNKKLFQFQVLNSFYKDFFLKYNSFYKSILFFYIFLFSYVNICLFLLNEKSLLSILIDLFYKQLIFMTTTFFDFSKYCNVNSLFFLDKRNTYLKKMFFFNLHNNNRLNNINSLFIKNLFSLDFFEIKKECLASFLFLYYFIKLKKAFIYVFSNFMNELFDFNFLNFLRLQYPSHALLKYYNRMSNYNKIQKLLDLKIIKKPNNECNFIKYYILNKFNNKYNTYEQINCSYIDNNKKHYFFYTLKFINLFFDLYEFLGNRWERHFFIWTVDTFYLSLLKRYIMNKLSFMYHLIVLLFIWDHSTTYFSRLQALEWKMYGGYKQMVFKYYRSRLNLKRQGPKDDDPLVLTGRHKYSRHLLEDYTSFNGGKLF